MVAVWSPGLRGSAGGVESVHAASHASNSRTGVRHEAFMQGRQ
jgi:hypothetical protein